MDEWGAIAEFYRQKKEKWAQTPSYYSGHATWASMYGPTLKPPMSLAELEKIEQQQLECTLPADLRYYLLHVSREIFVDSYPVEFRGVLAKNLGECTIDATRDWLPENDDDDDDGDICDGMLNVGNGGCAFCDLIVLKGTQVGTVWNHMDGSVTRAHASFLDYLKYGMKPMRPL